MTRKESLEFIKTYEGKIPRIFLKESLESSEFSEEEFHKIYDKCANKEPFYINNNKNLLKNKNWNLTLKKNSIIVKNVTLSNVF